MHPHLKSLLVKAGCDPNASDDEAQSYYDGMSADKRGEIDGALAAMMATETTDGLESKAGSPPPPGTAVTVPATLSAAQMSQISAATAQIVASVLAGKTPSVAAASARVGTAGPAPVSDADQLIGLETARVRQIGQLAALYPGKIPDELQAKVIGDNLTIADCRVAFLRHIHENTKTVPAVSVGNDKAHGSMVAALSQAIVMRANPHFDEAKFVKNGETLAPRTKELAGLRVKQMFQRYLASLGCPEVYEFSDSKLAECLGPRGLRRHVPRIAALSESTSDFANITLDAQNKSLRFFYLDAKRTWPIWAEKKFNPDFKNINRVVLSEAPSMQSRLEGGELQYVSLSDSKEVYVLAEYAAGIRVTRRTIINDDLDAFASIPRLQANSAARKEDDVAYAIVTVNANMADGGALFNATAYTVGGTGHQNYTSSGGAPSVTNLQVGSTMIRKQKGLANAARLELEGKFLLVPTSIEEQTKEFIGSKTLIASQSSSGSAPLTVGDTNPFYGRYQVVGSSRLDDNSATAWYLFADFRDGQVNTVEVCFLTDEPEPIIRQETDFDSEDVKMLCRHTVAAKAIDFRGLYKNNGA